MTSRRSSPISTLSKACLEEYYVEGQQIHDALDCNQPTDEMNFKKFSHKFVDRKTFIQKMERGSDLNEYEP